MNGVPAKVLDVLTASTTSLKSFTTQISNVSMQPIGAKIRDANAVVTSVIEGVTTTIANHENVEKVDSPNEYRNLLISLSGQKSDHVLWIKCLKQFQWKGDKDLEFSFELDKFGVPSLKNGNYSLNLCYDCLDLILENQKMNASPFDGFSCLWEGNYWDSCESLADDFAHLSAESISIVVNKCANIIKNLFTNAYDTNNSNINNNNNNCNSNNNRSRKSSCNQNYVKGRPILIYMPNVVQFLIIQLAAARVGAVLTFVNASINRKAEDLMQILELSNAEIVFTVDGFFMGEELQLTKQILDNAIEMLHSKSEEHRISRVVIVRHVGSNPNIPSPTVQSPVGRRPHYGLNVTFQSGRDLYWSNLMLEASEICECEWMESEDIIFNTIKKISDDSLSDGLHRNNTTCSKCYTESSNIVWHIESYTVGQIALLVRILARTMRSWSQTAQAGCDTIWPLVDADDLLYLSSLFAIPLAGFALLMCESPPTHPNPTRIFEIIEKHSVKQLLISENYIKLLIRNDDFSNVWQQDGDPTFSSSSLEMIYTVSQSRRENEHDTEWLQKCVPTANLLHLSC